MVVKVCQVNKCPDFSLHFKACEVVCSHVYLFPDSGRLLFSTGYLAVDVDPTSLEPAADFMQTSLSSHFTYTVQSYNFVSEAFTICTTHNTLYPYTLGSDKEKLDKINL